MKTPIRFWYMPSRVFLGAAMVGITRQIISITIRLQFMYEGGKSMAALVWDATGTREFEMGTKKGVLYPYNLEENSYDNGVAWNGLTAVTESPSGAEATDLYADDIKYASMRSAEDYGITIEAYTYPDEWGQCDGSAEVATGVQIGQQDRVMFAFSWVTTIGDDTTSNKGYKLHIAYGLTASPSVRAYTTINDSPDAISFSWECESN